MIASLHHVQIGYDDQGSGPPVVFLHGFPHDRSLWAQQRTALAARARCIAPDLRGFGESTSRAPYSMDQYADDVVALLDWLEIESAVICGLSMGGYVAMALWRRHPDRVRAMILCDTRATADSDETRVARNAMIILAHNGGADAVAEKQLPGMVGATTRARRPEVVESVRVMMARQSVSGIVGALEALRDRPDSRDTIASITVPVLIIVGDEDVLTPVQDAQAMRDLLPSTTIARFERIADSGHATCVERPAAVTHAIAEFLTAVLPDA